MSSLGTMVINLMARTEAFEKSMNRASNQVSALQTKMDKFSKMAGISTRAFAAIQLTRIAMEAATEYHAAVRKGEDATNALFASVLKNMPGVGNTIYNLAKETSGYNETLERLAEFAKVQESASSMQQGLDNKIRLLKASEQEVDAVKAKIEYETKLKKITEAEDALRKVKANDPNGRLGELKKKAAEEYWRTLEKITLAQQIQHQKNIEAAELERRKTIELKRQLDLEEQQLRLVKENAEYEAAKKRGQDKVDAIHAALESIKTPEQKSFDEYQEKLKNIDLLYKKNYISLEKWKKLEQEAWDAKINQDNNSKGTPFDSGQRGLQFNPADISLTGLAIGGTGNLQQQMLAEQKKIAQNTDPRNNKGTM